ncbi:MAG: hypothetical protein AAF639_17890 [Chloroflexota bacterium]
MSFVIALSPIIPEKGLSSFSIAQTTAKITAQTSNEEVPCANVAEADLRNALNEVAQDLVASNGADIDIATIVNRQWTTLNVDALIDARVDEAVARLQRETDIWDKFLSGWSPEKAEELTTQVADYTFGSIEFREAIDALSLAIAEDIAVQLTAISAESVAVTLVCLRSFIDNNYSTAIVSAFAQQLEASTEGITLDSEELETGILSIVEMHQVGLGGIGVIIAAQIAKGIVQRIGRTIAKRVGGRVVGRVVGRAGSSIIPAVGWVVGLGLIAYDLYTSRDGALPEIQTSLKSLDVKSTLKTAIIDEVEPELRRELPELARQIANELYNEWQEFNRKYRQTLSLAEQNADFRAILTEIGDLPKVAELADIVIQSIGQLGFEQSILDGSFLQAAGLPLEAFEIARHNGSLSETLSWAEMADSYLSTVVNLELYKHKSPDSVTRETLEALAEVTDPAIAAKLSLLTNEEISTLHTLATANMNELAETLSADDLAWVASYIDELDQMQTNRLISRLIAEPGVIDTLKSERTRSLLADSEDVGAAIDFLTSPDSFVNLATDLVSQVNGSSTVSIPLMIMKYTAQRLALVVGILLLVILLFLWMLYRSLFGRQVVIRVEKD